MTVHITVFSVYNFTIYIQKTICIEERDRHNTQFFNNTNQVQLLIAVSKDYFNTSTCI